VGRRNYPQCLLNSSYPHLTLTVISSTYPHSTLMSNSTYPHLTLIIISSTYPQSTLMSNSTYPHLTLMLINSTYPYSTLMPNSTYPHLTLTVIRSTPHPIPLSCNSLRVDERKSDAPDSFKFSPHPSNGAAVYHGKGHTPNKVARMVFP
jgi:hypothetical protein